MKIQYGTSLAYPARCIGMPFFVSKTYIFDTFQVIFSSSIGAHITGIPNHITGNTTRAKTRALVAMCGTFGYELDLASATMNEYFLYRDYSTVYRTIASIVRSGDLYRLWNPFKVPFAVNSWTE